MVFRQDLEQFINTICVDRFDLDTSTHTQELYEPTGDLSEGLSGDPLYLIKNKEGRLLFIVKAFTGNRDTLQSFSAIMTASNFLYSLNLKQFTFTQPIAFIHLKRDDAHACLVAMEAAEGQSLISMIKSRSVENSLKAAAKLGKALAELNCIQSPNAANFSPYYLEKELLWFTDCVKAISQDPNRFPLNSTSLTESFFRKWKNVLDMPSPFSYIHGDAHPGNVFFNAETGVLTLTDFDRLVYSIDPQKAPAGPSGFEFVFARQSLKFSATAHHFSPEEIEKLDEAFVKNYKEGMGNKFPSQEVLDYYTALFWMRKVYLFATAQKDLMPVMKEQAELQCKMALQNLNRILIEENPS